MTQNQRQLVIASNNKHKLSEMKSILGSSWNILAANDVSNGITWDETGTTFLENARIKVAALRSKTSSCILADDSGLCVDYLNGGPGVYSSSFGGVEGDHARNVQKLLTVMKNVPTERRAAHFYCLILFLDEHNKEHVFEGRCNGFISEACQGTQGFGYDPIFIPIGGVKSMAEMTDQEKNQISHRGLALHEFKKKFAS
jgi:XTP/dITP diphosphohydrolase